MRIAIIQFPGSTCTRETSLAVARAGMIPVLFLWNDVIENLEHFAGYILVGGFSYEDRSRAGIIAALHPIMDVLKEQTELGKPLLGICNGAQILVEAGLVPGLQNYQLALSLTANKRIKNGKILSAGFYNAWVHICLAEHAQQGAFTRRLKAGKSINIPIAHGEGRFKLDAELWLKLKAQGCVTLHYCNEQGVVDNAFPINPNGSDYNLAAISNAMGNVMAIMPHPERSKEGDLLFQSMRDYIAQGSYPSFKSIPSYSSFYLPTIYRCPQYANELIIENLTTDNHAMTIERTLLSKGINAQFKRYIHWELYCSPESFVRIEKSTILYNSNKEQYVNDKQCLTAKGSIGFLIRAKEDVCGQQKSDYLKQHLGADIQKAHHSVLWVIHCAETEQEQLVDYLLNSYLLFNPHAHDCSYYSFSAQMDR
jgi:phosphoribosylformylglycinamidine synthase